MILGIDVPGLVTHLLPILPGTLVSFVPQLFGSLGGWGGCIAQNGLTSPLCQGM